MDHSLVIRQVEIIINRRYKKPYPTIGGKNTGNN